MFDLPVKKTSDPVFVFFISHRSKVWDAGSFSIFNSYYPSRTGTMVQFHVLEINIGLRSRHILRALES